MTTIQQASVDMLRVRRILGRHIWAAPEPWGGDSWAMRSHDRQSSVIVSVADHDGQDWIHASIAHRDRTPDYDDLKALHAAVFGAGWAYQVFAPPSEHVNLHEHALHLFGRLDGCPALPDFTEGSGSI